MKTVIDQAWESLLQGVLKKGTTVRNGIGDGIDLYVPQSRILALAESDPTILKSLYYTARESAKRNAVTIVTKLGMPTDYFWKFEYWPKARAYEMLEKIVSRIFTSILRYAKEGELKITDLEIEPLRIDITFSNCAECAGLEHIEHNICYYHAGTLAGILSGLLNIELEAYETDCHANGADSCRFRICDVSEDGAGPLFESYIAPPHLHGDISLRLAKTLDNEKVRPAGNVVTIQYLQLALANSLAADPEQLARDSFETGFELGSRLSPLVSGYFGDDPSTMIPQFYLQLGEFDVAITREAHTYRLVLRECAECAGSPKLPEMTAFLTGEMCGMISSVTQTPLQVTESKFDGDELHLTFSPEG